MKQHDLERDIFEKANLGGYEQILPSPNPKYKEYLETAKKVWTAFNASNVRKDDVEKLRSPAADESKSVNGASQAAKKKPSLVTNRKPRQYSTQKSNTAGNRTQTKEQNADLSIYQ